MSTMQGKTLVARPRYRIALVEQCGATYEVSVASRDESVHRITEAFAANPDIVYADLFTPAGDWSERITRTSQTDHLVAAPATDATHRRTAR